MNSVIRKSSVYELDQIKEIARQTIDANYRSFLDDEGVDWFIGSGASDQYISDNIDDCWVLLCDDQIRGFCVCKSNLIDLMMVHNFYRLGYGTMLLKHCEEYLFSKFEAINLESFEGNDKANNFYRKNGWIEKERKFDEASGKNKLTFTKES
jgi:GNAT superfamily N-acetyltransferase